jgi:hypothetical protein
LRQSLLAYEAVIRFLKSNLSYSLLVACGGLYLGVESSLCEMGFTLLAVIIWRQLGKEGGRVIAIGVGRELLRLSCWGWLNG